MRIYVNLKISVRAGVRIIRPRSRVLRSGLIRFFFYPKQCFSLTNSYNIPLNHPNSSRIPRNERALSVENGSGRRWVEYIRRHKSWLTASSSSSSQFVFTYRTLVRSSTSCRRRPGARQAIDGGAARPSRSAAPDGGVDRPACSVGRRAYPTRATPLFSCAESTTNSPYLL